MVTQLVSRFTQNDSTWVTVNHSSQSYFYKIPEFLMDKPTSVAHKEKRIFAPVMIKIGANFLFRLSSHAMLHFEDQVHPTCTEADLRLFFNWGVSRAQHIGTLSWFNVVFAVGTSSSWQWASYCYSVMCPSHFCRITSPSSQCPVRVIWNFFESSRKKYRVIGLQARVNVESHEISHFFYDILHAMKWRPTCYKRGPIT